MNEKFKYLFKNTGLLFVSNFASKMLVFLLVPFYTSILSTSEYGTYDLLYTTIQMLVPIFSLNIADSVMRFLIDASFEKQQKIVRISVKYVVGAIGIIIGLSYCLSQIGKIHFLEGYFVQFVILFIAYLLYQVATQFARGIDDVKGLAIAGILSTFVMIVLNILFLLIFKLGIIGYFYAMILSLLIPAIYLFYRNNLLKYIKPIKDEVNNDYIEKDMLRYCVPLIFINLSWYINNVSDRYVVTFFSGIEANGVYSAAYKIPAILNAIQVVFIQAWQLSAVKEFGKENVDKFYGKTYQGGQNIMVVLCSGIIVSTKLLSSILFKNDFYEAWIYVPVLVIYIVFNTLSGMIGGVFTASKDTKSLAWSGFVGAIVNIVLNFVLVYIYGPIGAAVATLVSSIVIWIMRMIASRKYVKIKQNYILHIIQYLILFVQAYIMCTFEPKYVYFIEAILFIAILAIAVVDYLKTKREEINL